MLPTDQAIWPVNLYKIDYETVDPFGLPITASGALFVPQGVSNSLPLFSYQHGTEFLKSQVPSTGESRDIGLLFASSGYVTAQADYLGMGDSPGFHPYLYARTEATAVIDLLRAARTFCASNGIVLNSQLFLAGYSQGGHATMAADREIERNYTNEFTVTACAPMAGPYDMSDTAFIVLNNTNYPVRAYFPYVVAAWLPIYHLADTLEELLQPPYDQTLAPLLDGDHGGGAINAATPQDEASIFYPDYEAAFLSDTNHPLRRATADNDLLDWTPRAPMHLYHCSGDDQVPYTNSVIAYQTFTNNGACCIEMIDPGAPQHLNHSACFYPSVLSAKAWFDHLKE
jgi:Secretory lipase